MTELKLEIGEYYADRDGNKHQVMARDDQQKWFITYNYKEKILGEHSYNGGVKFQGNQDFELIEEWVEPLVKEFYIGIYSNDSVSILSEGKGALENAEWYLKLKIDITNKTAEVEVLK